MKNITISKQTYLAGLRCQKSLYNKVHHPELMNSGDNTNEAAMAAGLEFEKTAMDLIAPKGIDVTANCDHLDFPSFISKTNVLMLRKNVTIYQATFQSKSKERIMADIIIKKGKAIDLIEVKGVTQLQDYHYYDVAYQYHCIQKAGYNIKRVYLAHVNKEYIRQGDLTPDLVKMVDVTAKVIQIQQKITLRIASFRKTLSQKESPDVELGAQCTDPYPCAFKDHCFKQKLPENNIFDIKGLRTKEKFNLYYGGIISLRQVKDANVRLTNTQQIQVDCALNKQTIFERDKVTDWVKQLNADHGLYYLDFETICMATPPYDGVPYAHIPIQYSVHYENPNGTLQHHEFLADPNDEKDQRLILIERLIYVLNLYGRKSLIITFSRFESGRLNYLVGVFPQFKKEIRAIQNRLVDLADIFRNKWYYSPSFKGSYSIKYVLPVLCPDLSYSHLEIRNGGQASAQYLNLLNNPKPEKLRNDLLEYCKLDTLAMVKILQSIRNLIQNN